MKDNTKNKIFHDFYAKQRQIEHDIESAYLHNEELTLIVYNSRFNQADSVDDLIKEVLLKYRWLTEIYLWLFEQYHIDDTRINCFVNESCLLIIVSREATKTNFRFNKFGKFMEA